MVANGKRNRRLNPLVRMVFIGTRGQLEVASMILRKVGGKPPGPRALVGLSRNADIVESIDGYTTFTQK